MRKKSKLKINKLRYPTWFNILFFCLTIIAPISLIVIEGFKAPPGVLGTTFKISFSVICAAIIAWVMINHFWIKSIKDKLSAKQIALEHDYSIDNGNPIKIKHLWYQNEIKLSLFNLVSVVLYGGLTVLILLGVASKLMEVKGLIMIALSLYVIAYTIKFIIMLKGYEDEQVEDTSTTTN